MHMHGCHSHGHGPHGHRPKNFRRPERWNSGWSRGMACQSEGRCRKEQEGGWSTPRDGNHPWCHKHPVQHDHSKETQKHHFSHFMRKFHRFPQGHKHFHHHHHGHSHHFGHSHHRGHCCQGEMPPKSCQCMPESSQATCCNAQQNKNSEAGPSTEEAQKNTRSVGTETEEIEPSE